MLAEITGITQVILFLLWTCREGTLAGEMSFGTLLEQRIETNGRAVWIVNIFKCSELKYGVLKAVSCDSLHVKKRTGLSGVKPAGVTKKCDSDVRLAFVWASAGLPFA